jgi:NAD+ synthase (glutamine-hydrolysing)
MKLTLALAQINTRLGDVEANLEKHLRLADEARRSGADLLVFPELSLTGYGLQDLVSTVALRPGPDDPVFRRLLDASQEIDLVVGFVDEDLRSRFYIAAAYLSRVKWFTFITNSTCLLTVCSMKVVFSPGATTFAPSIPALAGSVS